MCEKDAVCRRNAPQLLKSGVDQAGTRATEGVLVQTETRSDKWWSQQ